ncbi:choline ABC transporter ATP-binding protein [Rhizobiaceae bacterium BDR2-2]|uniref:Choline ABC transporter ATP-binding protein n=1 Tax=Ectorhizobium quercum TaxID=2965071 RepID=A0AAE3SVQ2_9HYPH|nr:choline ABC transporter ATP-binding protein [Ectorhizobium quercum]MCX8996625.1 choline ABC transporter ATP-binding protein [Ectorhizobium quercum]
MTDAVVLKNIDIVYGARPQRAFPLIDQGMDRDEISTRTSLIAGALDASITVEEGELLVLMGLSGSGKSTLLRAVNGLAPVVRGSVTVQTARGPVDPYKASPKVLRDLRLSTVSMVFQQFALLPWRTVADNVGFGLELAGVADSERRRAVDEQLELVNLTNWGSHKVSELSGGMQQRVGLARAFATRAPILLMDEPFSALDPLIRARLQDELLEFQRRLKKTIIFVSHDLDEAFRIGNRIAIMDGGRIVQCGTPRDILDNPANQHVADFIAGMNPISLLTAADVMRPGIPQDRTARVAATAQPQTPLADVIDALARHPGVIGVVDKGSILGAIDSNDVVRGLSRYRRR